jgi:hypothetical protein
MKTPKRSADNILNDLEQASSSEEHWSDDSDVELEESGPQRGQQQFERK